MAVTFSSSGAGSGVNFGDPALLRDLDPITVSAWIYPTGWGGGSRGRIAVKEGSGGWGWVFYVDNFSYTGALVMLRYRGVTDANAVSVNSAISLNTWHHVAFRYSTGANSIFINGVETSYQVHVVGSGVPYSDILEDGYIGNRGAGSRGFDGKIEDVRIWDAYLSDARIANLYTSRGHDADWTDLVGRWPMRDLPAGTNIGTATLKDMTGGKNHGISNLTTTPFSGGIVVPRRRR